MEYVTSEQLKNMATLNKQMTAETENLTRALKGKPLKHKSKISREKSYLNLF